MKSRIVYYCGNMYAVVKHPYLARPHVNVAQGTYYNGYFTVKWHI